MREPTILREDRFESDVANGTSDSIDDGNPGDWEMPYLSGSMVRDDLAHDCGTRRACVGRAFNELEAGKSINSSLIRD